MAFLPAFRFGRLNLHTFLLLSLLLHPEHSGVVAAACGDYVGLAGPAALGMVTLFFGVDRLLV